MKTRIGIKSAIAEAIESLPANCHNDKPAIREALNDILDAYSRAGLIVTFNYNQPRAVRLVQIGLRGKASQ